METLPYKVIKSPKQYNEYCDVLEELVVGKKLTKNQQDVAELLTLLIEKWDQAHNTFAESDPVESLIFLMKDHKIKAVELAADLGVGKSLVSDILNYRRALSREVIRKLSLRFKVNQELFNRPYKLVSPANSQVRDTSVKNTRKKVSKAI